MFDRTFGPIHGPVAPISPVLPVEPVGPVSPLAPVRPRTIVVATTQRTITRSQPNEIIVASQYTTYLEWTPKVRLRMLSGISDKKHIRHIHANMH